MERVPLLRQRSSDLQRRALRVRLEKRREPRPWADVSADRPEHRQRLTHCDRQLRMGVHLACAFNAIGNPNFISEPNCAAAGEREVQKSRQHFSRYSSPCASSIWPAISSSSTSCASARGPKPQGQQHGTALGMHRREIRKGSQQGILQELNRIISSDP